MPWIKKNLVFVICSGIALLLLGVAVWFALSNKGRSNEIQEAINQETSNWQGLTAGAFPSPENIEAAKAEQEKVKKLWAEASSIIPKKSPADTNMTDQAFASLLGTTVAQLRNTANGLGVLLPPNYDFTFAAQRMSLNFAPGLKENWVLQLHDIRSICQVLYESRISALDSIQRAPASELEQGQGTDLLQGATIVSNQFAVVFPYQVTFRSFTPELAAVLSNLQSATNFIVLKSVVVAPAANGLAPTDGTGQPGAPLQPYAQPYQRPTPQPYPAQRRPGTAAAQVAETVISEHPLQVTLLLDVVKMNPVQ